MHALHERYIKTIIFLKEETMAIIQTISPEKAEGETKKIYDMMLQNVGVVPSPLQMASASPGICPAVHNPFPSG